jgi:uncharacterized protein (DUF1330 family)
MNFGMKYPQELTMTTKEAFFDVFSRAQALLLSNTGILEYAKLHQITEYHERDQAQPGCQYAWTARRAITTDYMVSYTDRLIVLGVILWLFPSNTAWLDGFSPKDAQKIRRVTDATALYSDQLSQYKEYQTRSERLKIACGGHPYSFEDANNPLFQENRPRHAIVITLEDTIKHIMRYYNLIKQYEELLPLVKDLAEKAMAAGDIPTQLDLERGMISPRNLEIAKKYYIERISVKSLAIKYNVTGENIRQSAGTWGIFKLKSFVQRFNYLLEK